MFRTVHNKIGDSKVRNRKGRLLTIRNTDNISGLVHTTLKLSFITAWIGVRIDRVKALRGDAISSLPKRAIRTVRTVKGIVKCVPEAPNGSVCRCLVNLVEFVIGLEQDGPLRPDKRLCCFEIQVRLYTSTCDILGSTKSPINVLLNRVRSVRNLRVKSAPERIEVLLRIMIVCDFCQKFSFMDISEDS